MFYLEDENEEGEKIAEGDDRGKAPAGILVSCIHQPGPLLPLGSAERRGRTPTRDKAAPLFLENVIYQSEFYELLDVVFIEISACLFSLIHFTPSLYLFSVYYLAITFCLEENEAAALN